jgi:hypothetical protein
MTNPCAIGTWRADKSLAATIAQAWLSKVASNAEICLLPKQNAWHFTGQP